MPSGAEFGVCARRYIPAPDSLLDRARQVQEVRLTPDSGCALRVHPDVYEVASRCTQICIGVAAGTALLLSRRAAAAHEPSGSLEDGVSSVSPLLSARCITCWTTDR